MSAPAPGTTPGRRRMAAIDPRDWLAEQSIERRLQRGHAGPAARQAIRKAQKSAAALKPKISR